MSQLAKKDYFLRQANRHEKGKAIFFMGNGNKNNKGGHDSILRGDTLIILGVNIFEKPTETQGDSSKIGENCKD